MQIISRTCWRIFLRRSQMGTPSFSSSCLCFVADAIIPALVLVKFGFAPAGYLILLPLHDKNHGKLCGWSTGSSHERANSEEAIIVAALALARGAICDVHLPREAREYALQGGVQNTFFSFSLFLTDDNALVILSLFSTEELLETKTCHLSIYSPKVD